MTDRPTRTYTSPVRAQRAAETRDRILRAFSEQLGRPGAHDISVAEAAAAAGVSVRTVQHHFPDRASRLEALAVWVDAEMGPIDALEVADDIPDFIRAAYARAERHEALTRAGTVAGMSREVRQMRASARDRHIRTLLDQIGAPEAETQRAAALINVLRTSDAGFPLGDVHGLGFAGAADAAAHAATLVIADLRARASSSG